MLRLGTLKVMGMALFIAALNVHAQRATEVFIPMGQSPGLSETKTIIGKIDTVGNRRRTISVTDSSGTYKVSIRDDTEIWLDNSKIRKSNQAGSAADFQPGRSAEVKYTESERTNSVTADWIKLEVAE